jgi:protein-tyrosine-phosphatase
MPASVLFACNMNAIRSPMAAVLLRAHTGGQIYTASAGVRGGEDDPFVSEVLAEIGLDLGGHTPHAFEALADLNFDLIVSLTPEAHHKAGELARTADVQTEYWPTMDPTAEEGPRARRLAAYRDLRDQLARRIAERFPRVSTFEA